MVWSQDGEHTQEDMWMKRTGIIAVVAVIIVILLLAVYFLPDIIEKSWGEEGELEITLTATNSEMTRNGTLEFKYTLKNVGHTKVRIVDDGYGYLVYNLNGTRVEFIGPLPDTAPPKITDKSLIVLEPGDQKVRSMTLYGEGWDIQKDTSYDITGCYWTNDYDEVTLPYWKEDIESKGLRFNVH
jgi:hypothetical protein